jgi:hypothetical protein
MGPSRGTLLGCLGAAALIAGTARDAAPQEAPPATRPACETPAHQAVAAGLEYLAKTQQEAGCWLGDVGRKRGIGYRVEFDRRRQEDEARGNLGCTALAGLAFLAAGHHPGRGPYSRALEDALAYVLTGASGHEGPPGYLSDCETRMYEHAFATLFLSQMLGMTPTRRAALRSRLTAAVGLIVDCQTPSGGWRYLPYQRDSDLSVTVCQLQALRAARDAGIHVGRACIDRAVAYVEKSYDGTGTRTFTYQIRTDERFRSARGSFSIDAAAVTSLQSAGIYASGPIARALESMEGRYEELSRDFPTHYFFYYGNYYAAQAFHQAGGDRARRYAERLRADLLARQQKDGRWRNDVGPGDEFATAMACLMLSVPDGLLPIFQK